MEILSKRHIYNNGFIVFGHRGVPELYPENTIESFNEAIRLKYSGLELDVVATKDNILIVHHDLQISGNQDTMIDRLSYKEINRIQPSIPKLEDVLSVLGHQTNINIEIKYQGLKSLWIAEEVIRLLKAFNLIDNIIISSFSAQVIRKSKILDDRFMTAWIWGPQNLYFFSHRKSVLNYFRPNAIHIKYQCISSSIIKKIHNYNMKVLAYTVNDEKTLKHLMAMGIDGVFTDSPQILQISKNIAG